MGFWQQAYNQRLETSPSWDSDEYHVAVISMSFRFVCAGWSSASEGRCCGSGWWGSHRHQAQTFGGSGCWQLLMSGDMSLVSASDWRWHQILRIIKLVEYWGNHSSPSWKSLSWFSSRPVWCLEVQKGWLESLLHKKNRHTQAFFVCCSVHPHFRGHPAHNPLKEGLAPTVWLSLTISLQEDAASACATTCSTPLWWMKMMTWYLHFFVFFLILK